MCCVLTIRGTPHAWSPLLATHKLAKLWKKGRCAAGAPLRLQVWG